MKTKIAHSKSSHLAIISSSCSKQETDKMIVVINLIVINYGVENVEVHNITSKFNAPDNGKRPEK